MAKTKTKSLQKNQAPAGGMTRKGATKAKPAKEAASTVRVQSAKSSAKAQATMTKEEKKEIKAKEREAEDRAVVVANILQKKSTNYQHGKKVWWMLLAGGLVLTGISWACMMLIPSIANDGTRTNIASTVTLVLAYAAIIAAFVYDWKKLRPVRKQTELEAATMSSKKQDQMLIADREAREARTAAKDAEKAAKKAARKSK